MPLIKDGKGVWIYVTVLPNGKRHSINTRTTDEATAKSLFASASAEPGMTDVPTLGQALEKWLAYKTSCSQSKFTIHHQRAYVKAWLEAMSLDQKAPQEIQVEDVNAWVNDTSKAKASSRLVRRSAVASFLQWCVFSGYCRANVARLVPVNFSQLSHAQKETKVMQVFTDGEINRMLEKLLPDDPQVQPPSNAWWSFAVTFGRWSGLRLSDIALLEWDCFAKPGKFAVWTEKTNTRVELPMNEQMQIALARAHQPVSHMGYVWPGSAAPIAANPERRPMLSVWFSRVCDAVNIVGKSFHSLRHTYCTDCDNRGVPIEHISRNVGHASTRMTEHYVHTGRIERTLLV